MIPHAHKWLTEQHEQREAAKREARAYTGMNAGNLSWRENRGGRDHSSIEGFDRASRQFAEENAHYGFDKDDHDTPAKVWELIREGKKKPPTVDDPEVRKIAEHWATQSRRRGPSIPDDDLPEWKSLNSVRKGWITLKPHGDDSDAYVHVLIDGNGKILAGPEGMQGKNVAHLSDTHGTHGEESRTHPSPKKPKESVDNPPNTASIMSGSSSEPDKNAKQGEGGGKVENEKRTAYLTGDTFQVKEALKDAGWRWSQEKKVFEKEVDADATEADVVRGIRMIGGVRNRPKNLHINFPEQQSQPVENLNYNTGSESSPSKAESFTRRTSSRSSAPIVGNTVKNNDKVFVITKVDRAYEDDHGKYVHNYEARPATEEESKRHESSVRAREIEATLSGMRHGPDDDRAREEHNAKRSALEAELAALRGVAN